MLSLAISPDPVAGSPGESCCSASCRSAWEVVSGQQALKLLVQRPQRLADLRLGGRLERLAGLFERMGEIGVQRRPVEERPEPCFLGIVAGLEFEQV